MTEIDTAELVRRAAAGDEFAWRQLVTRYGPLLRHVARTYRLGDDQAADLIATTWLKLFEHISSLRDGSHVAGWLITTLRRDCGARLRHERREQPVGDFIGSNEPVEDIDLDRRLTAEERRRLVGRALAQLPERERRLLEMLFRDPAPSYREISRSLSMPIGSIGPTRSRLLVKLRSSMSTEEIELALAG